MKIGREEKFQQEAHRPRCSGCEVAAKGFPRKWHNHAIWQYLAWYKFPCCHGKVAVWFGPGIGAGPWRQTLSLLSLSLFSLSLPASLPPPPPPLQHQTREQSSVTKSFAQTFGFQRIHWPTPGQILGRLGCGWIVDFPPKWWAKLALPKQRCQTCELFNIPCSSKSYLLSIDFTPLKNMEWPTHSSNVECRVSNGAAKFSLSEGDWVNDRFPLA